MEPEDIVVVPAETTPTVEPVVETAPQPSAEDLEIYSLGLAAKQGWAPVQPVVDNTPKAPTYPGTSTPLPSNFEDLDPMVQQAMHEMAIANEQNLQTQLTNQRMQTTQEMAPILRQAAIAQIASSHKGIDNDDARLPQSGPSQASWTQSLQNSLVLPQRDWPQAVPQKQSGTTLRRPPLPSRIRPNSTRHWQTTVPCTAKSLASSSRKNWRLHLANAI